ncbi:MAG TPA: hypothetical protein PKW79_07555, partial [Rhabdochlamydiaceae bacterium]|nr:hypothetical protein [Rhabdochlamydiaceae bacterium]
MAFIGEFPQHVLDAGLHSCGRGKGNPNFLGDLISDFKSDPANISCKGKRVLLDLFNALIAILFVDFLGVSWSDTDWLKHLEEIRQDQA